MGNRVPLIGLLQYNADIDSEFWFKNHVWNTTLPYLEHYLEK